MKAKRPKDEKEKKFAAELLPALAFIDKLLAAKNTTGRLHSKRRGESFVWDWSVTYKEKGKA